MLIYIEWEGEWCGERWVEVGYRFIFFRSCLGDYGIDSLVRVWCLGGIIDLDNVFDKVGV